MEFTGERMIPGCCDWELETEHRDRYLFAQQFVTGKRVLDAACGSGYGSNLLAKYATQVVGIDISDEAIQFAKDNFARENILFEKASIEQLPLENHAVDVVVSFETLEHVNSKLQSSFLDEIERVLTAEGVLIISTPNHEVYKKRGGNHFHVHELTCQELKASLKKKFKNVELFCQQWEVCDTVVGKSTDICKQSTGRDVETAEYLVAVCSNIELPNIRGQVSIHREKKYESVLNWAIDNHNRNEQSNRTISELKAELKKTDDSVHDLQELDRQNEAQRKQLEEKIQELNIELRNKQGHIELLLQSDRELERIHNSRSWKFMGFFWKIRDTLLPKNSRRRLLLKLFAKFLRHPIHFIGKINKQRIKRLVDGMQTGQIQDTVERMNRCFDSGDVHVEPVQLIDAPQVESMNPADYEHFSVPTSLHPKVSIVIPVYNQFHYTYACLKSIAVNSGEIPYEVLIANDCSTDLTTQLEKIVGGVKVITNEKNLRFLRNCNHAAKEAKGEYILFLNNDTQVQPNWLQPLVDLIESDETIGMVGSKLIYPNGRLQEAGGIIWKDASAWNYGNGQNPAMPEYNYVKEVDYISGAAIMIRSTLWNQLGGFDETFAPAYCEDSDLAFQVRAAGYKVMFQPKSVVVHFEGVSNGTNTSSGQKAYQVRNQKKFYEKWKDVLEKENNSNGVDPFRARDRSLHKKTLLMIDHYVPQFDKDAGSRSMFQYLKLFVSQGYNVKFLGDNFYQHEPYTTILQQMGIEVLYGVWYRDHWQEWIEQNADDFDYIFLSRPHITVKYVDFVREKTHAKLVYYGHDLHFLREQKKYESTGDPKALEDSIKFKKMESSIFEKVDTVYYLNKEELETVKAIAPSANVRRSVINIFEDVPDIDYVPAKRQDILFVGGFGHDPNVDAIIWAVREIMPKIWEKNPDIKLRVVGSNATKEVLDLASDRVILEGFVSDEKLKEIYSSCKVVLVPLRYGGGIKGKVVEAMRYGIPLITTETGAEGLDGIEKFIPIAKKEAQDVVQKTLDLYHDDAALVSTSKQEVEYIRKNMSVEHALSILSKDFDFSRK